jgi:hypothetical protein
MNSPTNAKCPKCDTRITRVIAGHTTAEVPMGSSWNSIVYECPNCHALLGVQIDPIALKTDIIEELFKKLRK